MPSKNSDPTPSAIATIANIGTTAQNDKPCSVGTFAKIAPRNTTLTTCMSTGRDQDPEVAPRIAGRARMCAPSERQVEPQSSSIRQHPAHLSLHVRSVGGAPAEQRPRAEPQHGAQASWMPTRRSAAPVDLVEIDQRRGRRQPANGITARRCEPSREEGPAAPAHRRAGWSSPTGPQHPHEVLASRSRPGAQRRRSEFQRHEQQHAGAKRPSTAGRARPGIPPAMTSTPGDDGRDDHTSIHTPPIASAKRARW